MASVGVRDLSELGFAGRSFPQKFQLLTATAFTMLLRVSNAKLVFPLRLLVIPLEGCPVHRPSGPTAIKFVELLPGLVGQVPSPINSDRRIWRFQIFHFQSSSVRLWAGTVELGFYLQRLCGHWRNQVPSISSWDVHGVVGPGMVEELAHVLLLSRHVDRLAVALQAPLSTICWWAVQIHGPIQNLHSFSPHAASFLEDLQADGLAIQLVATVNFLDDDAQVAQHEPHPSSMLVTV